jgi:quinol monooxygenase YgiN
MWRLILLLLASLTYAGTMSLPANSQAPPAPPPTVPAGPRYVVTYLEVSPTATADGTKAVRQFRDAVRAEPGNLRAEVLQRLGQPYQLVLLEAWQDQTTADTHAQGSSTLNFHQQIKAIENAPADVRIHFPLSVAALDAVQSGAVAIVTHVDVIPPQRENGTAIVKQLAEDSRRDSGNLRFEAVTQVNRQNHFTLIEVWRDRQSAEAHTMAVHTRTFREKLAPASGALYDERLYSVLD